MIGLTRQLDLSIWQNLTQVLLNVFHDLQIYALLFEACLLPLHVVLWRPMQRLISHVLVEGLLLLEVAHWWLKLRIETLIVAPLVKGWLKIS